MACLLSKCSVYYSIKFKAFLFGSLVSISFFPLCLHLMFLHWLPCLSIITFMSPLYKKLTVVTTKLLTLILIYSLLNWELIFFLWDNIFWVSKGKENIWGGPLLLFGNTFQPWHMEVDGASTEHSLTGLWKRRSQSLSMLKQLEFVHQGPGEEQKSDRSLLGDSLCILGQRLTCACIRQDFLRPSKNCLLRFWELNMIQRFYCVGRCSGSSLPGIGTLHWAP